MRRFLIALLFLAAPLPAAPPDLIVVLVIDQFPQEYIDRFAPHFAPGGFRQLMTEGAYYPQAWYPFATTYTCSGHATIGTGRLPSEHGIIANEWFDDQNDRTVYCVDDARARGTAGNAGAYSPVLLGTDSLGDRLQERTPGSKIIGIGLKDRSGILMAGRKGDAAYWFDDDLPAFVSSSYYQFNPRVLDFNARLASFIAANPRWEPLKSVSGGAVRTDDPPELRKHKGSSAGSTQFPHEVPSVDEFVYTPFANDLVFEFARHVIDVEWMGREDGAPDILWVGLSAMDYLGHLYGPDSLEVADAVLRLDRSLALFLDDLERRFGDRVTVAVTADHGTQAIPELARARGRDAGRVGFGFSENRVKTIGEMPPHRRTLETRIAERLGVELPPETPVAHRLILRTTTPNFYLNWPRIEALGLDPESVRRATRDSLLEIEGVAAAFTASELSVVRPPKSEIERAARLSFYADRSGDVIAYLKPGWIYSGGTTGSTHGQPVEADQHVLLMLWGNGIPARTIDSRVEIHQLARSLGHLLGIDAGTPGSPLLPGLE